MAPVRNESPESLEADAIRVDAARRLRELVAVRRFLWPDRDDPEVLSELVSIQGQVRQAEAELSAGLDAA